MKQLKRDLLRLTPENRLHGLSIPIIGLTGGIATGKSTVSKLLLNEGLPVIDADRLVKSVYEKEETKDFIRQRHPDAWEDGAIDFAVLRRKVFSDSQVKAEIEAHIYSRLPQAFLEALSSLGSPSFVIYDVPLLFEKGLADKVDLSVLVYAPRELQIARTMKRDGSSEELATSIVDQQLSIEDKRKRAAYVLENTGGKEELAEKVKSLLDELLV